MFTKAIDGAEIDLINKVAAIIDSGAFDRRAIIGTAEEQAVNERIQENNRQRARDMAVSIIDAVRTHKS